MKKKIMPFAVCLAAILSVGLAGCNNNNNSSSLSSSESISSNESSSEEVSESSSEEVLSSSSSSQEVIHVESVTITAEKTNLFVGDKTTVMVTVLPETADDKTYTLSSSDTAVLTVDETGQVTAVAKGTADVIATSTDGAKTGKVTIVVEEASAPVFTMPSVKQYTVKVGEELTLPTVSAKDYRGNDLTSSIELEDLNETGSIKDGKFKANIAGEHRIAYYVEDPTDSELFAEEEIVINVTPAHEETFDVTGFQDPSTMTEYGTFKENFAQGTRSPTYRSMADSNNATHLSGGEDAIAGNSLILDANRTAGSASNCIFMNQFNDYFHRGISATYTVSFSYKILSASAANFSDFYVQMNWDGSNGLNQNFINSNTTVNEVHTASFTFPGTIVPETGNAWFGFFKLSGSTTDAIIAIDNLEISSKEIAQIQAVVPTSEQLSTETGFTWNMDDKGAGATNGEAVIINNIENETAKQAMIASDKFTNNALKLTNADGHLFTGLTKNNMVEGKKLTIEIYYYGVNSGGLCLIMMGDNGNPTLPTTTIDVGNGIFCIKYEGTIQSGWNQLNIYGANNPSFEIYIGSVVAKLEEAEAIPDDQTPNGHKVGFTFSQDSRQFGNCDDATRTVGDFDGDNDVIANEAMGSAPKKLVFKNGNTTTEWFQGNGRIENTHTYKISLDYYVKTWNGGRFMYNFDNNVFLDIGSVELGYHHSEITWVANRTVDFFSFFAPDAGSTGTIYVNAVTVELTAIAK